MDPQVTYDEMLAAAAARDWKSANEKAEALLAWLKQKGYPPVTSPQPGLSRTWHKTAAYFACRLVQTWKTRRRNGKRGNQ